MMKNTFGGGNSNSLYVPMSEVEQEAIARLVESADLRIHVVGWGIVHNPRVTFGDLRLSFQFQLDFNRPEVPMAVTHLDLELRTGAGELLFRDRQPTTYGGQPMMVAAGLSIGMIWDIAIHHIDPKLVKALVPGAKGLTSRVLDRDTGAPTMMGNMKLTPAQQKLLRLLRTGEAHVRQITGQRLALKK